MMNSGLAMTNVCVRWNNMGLDGMKRRGDSGYTGWLWIRTMSRLWRQLTLWVVEWRCIVCAGKYMWSPETMRGLICMPLYTIIIKTRWAGWCSLQIWPNWQPNWITSVWNWKPKCWNTKIRSWAWPIHSWHWNRAGRMPNWRKSMPRTVGWCWRTVIWNWPASMWKPNGRKPFWRNSRLCRNTKLLY